LRLRNLALNMAAAAMLFAATAYAQSAQPTASKLFELSTFGGLNGTYTGLSGGKNLGITAGVDVGIHARRSKDAGPIQSTVARLTRREAPWVAFESNATFSRVYVCTAIFSWAAARLTISTEAILPRTVIS